MANTYKKKPLFSDPAIKIKLTIQSLKVILAYIAGKIQSTPPPHPAHTQPHCPRVGFLQTK